METLIENFQNRIEHSLNEELNLNQEELLSNEINESLSNDIIDTFNIKRTFKDLLDNNYILRNTGYIEDEKILFESYHGYKNTYIYEITDLSNAMKTGKKVYIYRFHLEDGNDVDLRVQISKEMSEKGVLNWIKENTKKYNITIDDEKSIEKFSPFAIQSIKPLKKLNPKKVKFNDVVKIVANGQYTRLWGGHEGMTADLRDDVVGAQFIKELYTYKGGWYMYAQSINDTETTGTINLGFGTKENYKLDYDLTKK